MAHKMVELYHRTDQEFPGQLTPVGAILKPRLTFDQWVRAGEILLLTRDMASWALGDWQIYGQAAFGVRHAQALSDYSRETLLDYRRVCKVFPRGRRRPALSFGHHRAVYHLTNAQQEELLDLCEKNRWTRDRLREELNRRRGQPELLTDSADPFVRTAEPSSSEPKAAKVKRLPKKNLDAAALFLKSRLAAPFPHSVASTLLTLLEERSKLLAVLEAAKISVAAGIVTPNLKTAVAALP